MCTHAAREREIQGERQQEKREDRSVTGPIRLSDRGIDDAQLPVMFGYQLHPGTNPKDRAGEHRPVTNYVRYPTCSVAIHGKKIVRLPIVFGIRPARLPSMGRRASGYRLPIRAMKETERRRTGRRAGGQALPSSSS
ncbi:unnamed protein product [Sphagnum jensenii]|uniref:Uncharacterized protein n=1 Tax=Sphagnum jensenii TaxID=128206 RepID=A0ABP1AF21_9BRYO